METTDKRHPRKHDEEFKRAAVELMLNSGKMVKEVAQDLGVSKFSLYEWRKQYAPPPGVGVARAATTPEALAAENAALRRENEYLRTQRDILKKTLGIVCEPPRSATNGSTK